MSDEPGSGGPDDQFVVPVPPGPPVPPSPYAGPLSWSVTPGAPAAGPPGPVAIARADHSAEQAVDPLIGQIGAALFWVTVGWWLFFVVRLLGRLVRVGFDDTIVIRTIDAGPEETVLAAVLSAVAALLLLLGRGRAGRSPLGWASLALAVLTVAITVWRLLP